MKKAVTLLELLVVVLIVGILATIAVPKFSQLRAKAKLAEAYTVFDMIKVVQEDYYMENRFYADKILDLNIDMPSVEGRRFDYGTKIGVGFKEPDGNDPGNNQIYTTICTDQNYANELAPDYYHPHLHERGVIGVWRGDSVEHSHGDLTHTHIAPGWESIP